MHRKYNNTSQVSIGGQLPRQADWDKIGASRDPVPYLGTIMTSRKNKESSREPDRPMKRKTFPYRPDVINDGIYPDKHQPSLAAPSTLASPRKVRGTSKLNMTPNRESAKYPPTHHTQETMSLQPTRVRDYSRGNLDGLLKFRANDKQ